MPPLSLHPHNPHYFLFRGKPTLLISSAEHYGAVLNADFDYARYLDELRRCGLNQTRVFSGVYCEDPGAFNITDNTLAPAPGRLLAPWARSETPGFAGGGAKFDLSRWDERYFQRLKDFVRQAGERGVVVEMVLFCPYYKDGMWNLSPLKAGNNVNGSPDVPREEVLTLKHPQLLAAQEAMVRKVVAELRGFDNLYYEVCNEPYFGGVTMEWQDRIIHTIVEAESGFPAGERHLIAQNIANGTKRIEAPNPAVSIFNFHYAAPPDAVAQNYALDRPVAFDETGFRGTADLPYRTEGWDFILAGGAVYSHLDYSFTTTKPDGTAPIPPEQPGGGGQELRKQIGILKRFIESFDFVRMRPDTALLKGGVPEGATARVLSEPGKAYALYLKGGTKAVMDLDLPAGSWRCRWIDTKTGSPARETVREHPGGLLRAESPEYREDLALRIERQ